MREEKKAVIRKWSVCTQQQLTVQKQAQCKKRALTFHVDYGRIRSEKNVLRQRK
jgi:hypothetical protein